MALMIIKTCWPFTRLLSSAAAPPTSHSCLPAHLLYPMQRGGRILAVCARIVVWRLLEACTLAPPPIPSLFAARPPLQVTVFGKRSSEAKYAEIASLAKGINWKAADWAKVVVLPEQTEWPALVTKAGTV